MSLVKNKEIMEWLEKVYPGDRSAQSGFLSTPSDRLQTVKEGKIVWRSPAQAIDDGDHDQVIKMLKRISLPV